MHDFRSDTVTRPTPAMMAAVAAAHLGDAARGDDPTVSALEARVRELTGKADALLLPSGTMANLAALVAHGCAGGGVVVEADAHLVRSEGDGYAWARATLRPLRGERGVLSADAIAAALADRGAPGPRPRLVCLEDTHNAGGGSVYPLDALAAIHAVAQRAGVPVHVDGARLFNAAAALGRPIRDLAAHADSLWFALCKGLGAPVGAVLAGDAAFMRDARAAARMLGGAMRQAGLIAAPALVALDDDPLARHRRDHALAHRLAIDLAGIDARLVDPTHVPTNIVYADVGRLAGGAEAFVRSLADRGVRALARADTVRFVTHRDVDEASVRAAGAAVRDVLRATPAPAGPPPTTVAGHARQEEPT